MPQRKESRLDLVVAGSKDGIVMVEAGAKEVTEEEAFGALEAGARGDQVNRATASTRSPQEAGRKKLRDARCRPATRALQQPDRGAVARSR